MPNAAQSRSATVTRRLGVLLLLTGALFAAAPPAAWAAPGKAELEQAARKATPKGAELKHPILVVDLGALGPAAVALYAAEDQSTYSGLVVMASGAAVKAAALPPVNEIEGRFEMTPASVFTTDDAAGRKALVVLYSYYINGSGQPEDYAGYVYRWDGGAWRIDDRRTARLAGARTAKAARAKLATVR
jgi:hypothetical protein